MEQERLGVRPQDAGKATLVLDMNGTLVSSCEVRRSVLDALVTGGSSKHLYDVTMPVRYSDTYKQQLSIRKRPGLDEFLRDMSQLYEIIIFSHSEEPHVRAVHELIDPGNEMVSHWLSRASCDGNSKDLTSPKFGRDLRRVVWLDDSPASFANCADNGIVVPSFDVEKCHARGVDPGKDTLLADLAPFLKAIASVEDVRQAIAPWKAKKCKVVNGRLLLKNTAGWWWGWHPFGEEDPSGGCIIM